MIRMLELCFPVKTHIFCIANNVLQHFLLTNLSQSMWIWFFLIYKLKLQFLCLLFNTTYLMLGRRVALELYLHVFSVNVWVFQLRMFCFLCKLYAGHAYIFWQVYCCFVIIYSNGVKCVQISVNYACLSCVYFKSLCGYVWLFMELTVEYSQLASKPCRQQTKCTAT